jgi:zinc transporter ZupT
MAAVGPGPSLGQCSGMVEPLAGLVGAAGAAVARPLLPYALSFAAGAMLWVVLDEIVPETHAGGHARLASTCALLGFLVMTTLDVGLG